MVDSKIKLLLVCEDELPRTLTTLELQKHNEIEFIGSCEYGPTMERFLTIYHPDAVLVYAYGKKKGEYYKCVRYIRNHTNSKIIVLAPEMADYDVHLFFRYGAHSVTDGSCDVVRLIKDTLYQMCVTKFPAVSLESIPHKHKSQNNKYKRGSVENFVAYNSVFIHRRYYANAINTDWAMTHLFLMLKKDALKYVLKMKSERELPEKASDLVDYCCLYPETFCSLVQKNQDKPRFLFVLTKEKLVEIEKLRNKKREEYQAGEVNYKGYTYDFEMSERFKIGYDKQGRSK